MATLALALCGATSAGAAEESLTIYQWTDSDGAYRYTPLLDRIPEHARHTVVTIESSEQVIKVFNLEKLDVAKAEEPTESPFASDRAKRRRLSSLSIGGLVTTIVVVTSSGIMYGLASAQAKDFDKYDQEYLEASPGSPAESTADENRRDARDKNKAFAMAGLGLGIGAGALAVATIVLLVRDLSRD